MNRSLSRSLVLVVVALSTQGLCRNKNDTVHPKYLTCTCSSTGKNVACCSAFGYAMHPHSPGSDQYEVLILFAVLFAVKSLERRANKRWRFLELILAGFQGISIYRNFRNETKHIFIEWTYTQKFLFLHKLLNNNPDWLYLLGKLPCTNIWIQT